MLLQNRDGKEGHAIYLGNSSPKVYKEQQNLRLSGVSQPREGSGQGNQGCANC